MRFFTINRIFLAIHKFARKIGSFLNKNHNISFRKSITYIKAKLNSVYYKDNLYVRGHSNDALNFFCLFLSPPPNASIGDFGTYPPPPIVRAKNVTWHFGKPLPSPLRYLVTLSWPPPPGPPRVSRIIWMAPNSK